MISLSLIDHLVIFFYAIILLLIGFLAKKFLQPDRIDFLLASRSLTIPLFVMTTVATWYGGILGVGEFTFRYGLNAWIMQGLPYYIFAVLFAIFFSKKIRQSKLITIPEKVELAYDKRLSLLSSILLFVSVLPAPYALMVGIILELTLGISLWFGILIGLFLSSIYLFYAGFRSNIFTDVYQFILMFIGFVILFYFSFDKLGSFDYLKNNLESKYLTPFADIPLGYFIVWVLIGLWTFVDPGFHQRSYAAKDDKVAIYGIFISIIFWFVFDFLTTITGLFSKAFLVNLANPLYSYPIYADKILPPFYKGLFVSSLLATIISTLNSYNFISAQTLGNDILSKLVGKNNYSVQLVKISLVVTILLSFLFAFLIPSVIDLWYAIGSLVIPGLLFLVVGSYYEKFKLSPKLTLMQVISVTVISTIIYLLRTLKFWETQIEPMIAGIVVGLLFQLSRLFLRK